MIVRGDLNTMTKKLVACPSCEWAKKLFTLERFEKIEYFLDETDGEFWACGTTKKVYKYDYLKQVNLDSVVVIITDSSKYESIKVILENLGLRENYNIFNGWKLSHEFYELLYADKEWIEFEKTDGTVLENMRRGWEKRAEKMSAMIPKDVQSILDIGCGESLIKKYLPINIKYIGLDYCARENTDFICDINNEKLPDVDVDLVYMAGVMEYVHNIEQFLKQLKKKYILISLRRKEGFIRLDSFVSDGYMNYGKTECFIHTIINAMQKNGFLCIRMEWPWRERDEYYLLFENQTIE